jgi:hypothetical protein
MLLDMFRTPLCPSSGASYCCGVGSVVSSSLVLLLLLLSRVSVDESKRRNASILVAKPEVKMSYCISYLCEKK